MLALTSNYALQLGFCFLLCTTAIPEKNRHKCVFLCVNTKDFCSSKWIPKKNVSNNQLFYNTIVFRPSGASPLCVCVCVSGTLFLWLYPETSERLTHCFSFLLLCKCLLLRLLKHLTLNLLLHRHQTDSLANYSTHKHAHRHTHPLFRFTERILVTVGDKIQNNK